MNEEIKVAAADYRASKEQAPEALTAKDAMRLEQAVANYDYYSRLATENLVVIKKLTADSSKDTNLAIIAAKVAELDVASNLATEAIGVKQ